MKITEKQYALSLLESVKDKNKEETGKILESFARLLAANNDISRADKIIREFNNLWDLDKGILEAEVISTSVLAPGLNRILKEYIKNITKAETVEIAERTDRELLGGVVLKYGDKVMDASLKTRLKALREEMKK